MTPWALVLGVIESAFSMVMVGVIGIGFIGCMESGSIGDMGWLRKAFLRLSQICWAEWLFNTLRLVLGWLSPLWIWGSLLVVDGG